MNWNPWITIAVFALLPLTASADPLLTFGPDVPLFITAAASVRRDSNVDLTAADTVADTVYVLMPGVQFHFTGGSGSVGLSAAESFVRYDKNANLNDDLANVSATGAYTGANLQLTAAAAYQEEDQSTLTVQNTNETVKHSMGDVVLNSGWDLTAKTKLGLGAEFDRTVYPEVGFVDTDAVLLPVDLYYAVTPKVDVSVGYRYEYTRLATGLNDSNDQFVNLGARGQFTPKLSGQVRVGIDQDRVDQGPTDSTLGFSGTLDYLFSPRTTFDLTGSNSFSRSPLGSLQQVAAVSLSGTFVLSQAWSANLGASFDATKYLVEPSRTDDFWVGNVGVSYTWTASTAFQLAYVYRRNASTLALATFDDDVLSLSASSRF